MIDISARETLAATLRAAVRDAGLTQSAVGQLIHRDRSAVSRALSGRDLPPQAVVADIARVTQIDLRSIERLWALAASEVSEMSVPLRDGGPPNYLSGDGVSLDTLRVAVQNLLRRRHRSQADIVRLDATGVLTSSTLSSVLRGTTRMKNKHLRAIVRACGVTLEAENAWSDAWHRAMEPHRQHRQETRARQRSWWRNYSSKRRVVRR